MGNDINSLVSRQEQQQNIEDLALRDVEVKENHIAIGRERGRVLIDTSPLPQKAKEAVVTLLKVFNANVDETFDSSEGLILRGVVGNSVEQEELIRVLLEKAVLRKEELKINCQKSGYVDEKVKKRYEKAILKADDFKDEICKKIINMGKEVKSILEKIKEEGISKETMSKYIGGINAASRSGSANNFSGAIAAQKNEEFRALIDGIVNQIK